MKVKEQFVMEVLVRTSQQSGGLANMRLTSRLAIPEDTAGIRVDTRPDIIVVSSKRIKKSKIST
jgi:hypothetical protein